MGAFQTTQSGNDYDYIIVMQDHFTKWMEGRAICGKEALTVADAAIQEWILKQGTPTTLRSGWGKEFTAVLHQEVCDLLRIAKMYSTAYHSQANSMVEWWNNTLLPMLREVVSEQQDDWDDQLPALLSAYCSTPHGGTSVSPYCMLHGVEMTMPLDLVISDVGWEHVQ